MNRVELKGSESEVHAHIKFKLGLIAQGKAMPKPTNVADFEGAKGKGKV